MNLPIHESQEFYATMTTLREIRATHLLSIRELAARAHVAPSTIYLIESGRSSPRPAVILRLATALAVEPTAVDEFRQAIQAAQRPYAPPPRGTPSTGLVAGD
jgi:transcriptional regulator with XRE-family HTH domain